MYTKKILLNIPVENIIRQTNPIYNSSLSFKICEENYNYLLDKLKLCVCWLCNGVNKNDSNDILSKL